MDWRTFLGVALLSAELNCCGLFVRKSNKEPKFQLPAGFPKPVTPLCIRSNAIPNLTEWVPFVREASSYTWNDFQLFKKESSPPTPPLKLAIPPIFTRAAFIPGVEAKDLL